MEVGWQRIVVTSDTECIKLTPAKRLNQIRGLLNTQGESNMKLLFTEVAKLEYNLQVPELTDSCTDDIAFSPQLNLSYPQLLQGQ